MKFYIINLVIVQGTGQPASKKELKTEANKKRKQSLSEDTENDESSRDWWTKYFASIEAMIEVSIMPPNGLANKPLII